MGNTSSYSTVAQLIVDIFSDDEDLGFEAVYYGDQDLIPYTPTLCVDPGGIDRELSGISLMTTNTISMFLFIYHGPLQGNQKTRKECDEFTEAVVRKLHEDVTIKGSVISGYCTRVESGISQRGGATLRTSRITWNGLTKTGV